jgi:hypothetical protein
MELHNIPATDANPERIRLSDEAGGTDRILGAVALLGAHNKQLTALGVATAYEPERVDALVTAMYRSRTKIEDSIAPEFEITFDATDAPVVVAAIQHTLAHIEVMRFEQKATESRYAPDGVGSRAFRDAVTDPFEIVAEALTTSVTSADSE